MHVMSRLGLGQLMPLRGPNLLSPASGVCGVSLNAAYHLKLDVRPQPTCVCSACYLGLFLGEFGTHMPDSETLTKSLCESQQASWACHECCDQRMSVTPYPCSRIFLEICRHLVITLANDEGWQKYRKVLHGTTSGLPRPLIEVAAVIQGRKAALRQLHSTVCKVITLDVLGLPDLSVLLCLHVCLSYL